MRPGMQVKKEKRNLRDRWFGTWWGRKNVVSSGKCLKGVFLKRPFFVLFFALPDFLLFLKMCFFKLKKSSDFWLWFRSNYPIPASGNTQAGSTYIELMWYANHDFFK